MMWVSRIQNDGEIREVGTFKEEEAAARKYDEYASEIPGRALNFPRIEGQLQAQKKAESSVPTSKFIGVTVRLLESGNLSFNAKIYVNKKSAYLHSWKVEEDAARANSV